MRKSWHCNPCYIY